MSAAFVLRAYLVDGELLREQRFAALPIRIGRNALNDFSISEGIISRVLSNFHARIEPGENQILIRDVGSKNGVFVRQGDEVVRVPPEAPFDLASSNFEFFLGPQLRLHLEQLELEEDLPRASASGAVLGNLELLAPGAPMSMRSLGNAVADPPPLPAPASVGSPSFEQAVPDLPPLPPLPGAASAPQPGFHPSGGADFPHAPQPLPPQPPVPGGGWAPAPNVAHVAEASDGLSKTGHFAHVTLETLAQQGLRELAASLVPGKELRTAGDFARFITKLHDAIEVFCRSFIPMREGYAQFISSLDLQRAMMQRSMYRSRAYVAVEMAKDPESVAAALLDFSNESLDAHKAVEGIFADLMIHQVALLDGVMQGVRSLLEELSPDTIEQRMGRGKIGLALTGRHKAMWQAYCERFEELSEEGQAFSHIFGQDFSEAYREYQRRRKSGSGT